MVKHGLSKKSSDMIFREAMGVLKVPPRTIHLMYWAVRLFGCFAWQGNKRMKEKGLSRMAAVMPVKSTDVPSTLQAKQ